LLFAGLKYRQQSRGRDLSSGRFIQWRFALGSQLWDRSGDPNQRWHGDGAGIFPQGALFNGVSLSALSFGIGAVILTNDGTATGTFESTLTGTSLLGRRNIVVVGNLTHGSGQVGGPATYSGLCSIDLGDGTPLLTGLPFMVTAARLPNTQWGLTLLLGLALLPAAPVNTGIVTIQ